MDKIFNLSLYKRKNGCFMSSNVIVVTFQRVDVKFFSALVELLPRLCEKCVCVCVCVCVCACVCVLGSVLNAVLCSVPELSWCAVDFSSRLHVRPNTPLKHEPHKLSAHSPFTLVMT